MGKDDNRQDMCEICCRFKDADQIFDISPSTGQTNSDSADCLSTIYSGGSHGSKKKRSRQH